MRSIGMDVHRDFCEVAISDGGKARSAGRIATNPEELAVIPDHVVHPGLLGGWGCLPTQHQGEDPDEDSRYRHETALGSHPPPVVGSPHRDGGPRKQTRRAGRACVMG